MYFEMVVIQCWHSAMGGKLVGQRTRKPLSLIVSEFLFADDVHMAVVAKIYV